MTSLTGIIIGTFAIGLIIGFAVDRAYTTASQVVLVADESGQIVRTIPLSRLNDEHAGLLTVSH